MDSAAFESLMTSLVRDDDAQLSPGNISSAIELVINRYSKDRPLQLVEDCEVHEDLSVDLPSGWVNGFSSIVSIEAPIGRNPPSYVNEDYYYVYNLPASSVELRLLTRVVDAGSFLRICYVARHTATDTFFEDDLEALAYLGASVLCDQLAAYYSHDSAPSIQADSVDHADKARKFSSRARDYRARYDTKFGKGTNSNAAGTIVQADSPRRPGLFHR
ncbi:MAG: hypothetical protein R3332_08335 [Pseudohongiellaceae bacterium]|nr:hypothetical protein [Pseudohongiellaceae bacterium]